MDILYLLNGDHQFNDLYMQSAEGASQTIQPGLFCHEVGHYLTRLGIDGGDVVVVHGGGTGEIFNGGCGHTHNHTQILQATPLTS